FCKGLNVGIKYSKAKYVVLVNNDAFVTVNWLKELVVIAEENPRVGIVGSKILFENGMLQSTGHVRTKNFEWVDRDFKKNDKSVNFTSEEVEGVCGASMLINKNCFKEIGVFDEDFFMYCEDVDLCIRCKQRGWKIMYAPLSMVFHKFRGTSTLKMVRYYSQRNRLILLAKHYPKEFFNFLFKSDFFWKQPQEQLVIDLPLILSKLKQKIHDSNLIILNLLELRLAATNKIKERESIILDLKKDIRDIKKAVAWERLVSIKKFAKKIIGLK
ncbi:MAG: glycosyltransferase family 2 protein, partial [Nanoarchaeota archaeon]|nr:glycosyltransferase family 2 protein [Nanoarchaeota archaeon]